MLIHSCLTIFAAMSVFTKFVDLFRRAVRTDVQTCTRTDVLYRCVSEVTLLLNYILMVRKLLLSIHFQGHSRNEALIFGP